MELYEFTETVRIEGVPFTAGTVIAANAIPRGNLESLLQTRRLKKYVPPVEDKKLEEPKKVETAKAPEPVKATEPKKSEPKKAEDKKPEEPKK